MTAELSPAVREALALAGAELRATRRRPGRDVRRSVKRAAVKRAVQHLRAVSS